MAKSRARFLAELLGSDGLVKTTTSSLAGADGIIDLGVLPSIPNSKLSNSSITINSSATSLGGSITLTSANLAENTNLYYTNARADARITNAGSGNWNTAYGWGNHASGGYAPLASPTLTGTPAAPTASGSTSTTQVATTAFVQQELTTLIGGAPSTLNDLNELAAAINDDANYNSTLTTALATKLPLAGGTMTGNLTFNKESPNITLSDTSTSRTLAMFVDDNNSVVRASGPLLLQVGSQSAITIDASRNTTLAGTLASGAITTSGNVSVSGSAYTTSADLNLLGDGLAIKNDKAGSSNNWSLIQNTDTGSAANLSFTTGLGVALTLNHNKSASFAGSVTSTGLTVNAAQSNFNDSAGSVIAFQKSASAKAWIANRSYGFHDGNGLAINTTDANPIRFGTNNTERMRLTSTGLGIGTQAPQRLLHINGTEGVARFTSTASGNSGLEVGVGTNSQAFMWHTENAHMEFATNNIERIRIDSSGRVGINRTPSISNSKLEVGGADNVSLINVEASGVTGGMGVGSTGLQFFHGSSSKMAIASNSYIHMAAASDVRLTLGSQGTAGNNDANWIRGNGNALSFNSAAGNYIWEVGGATKMTLTSTGSLSSGAITSTGAISAEDDIYLTDAGTIRGKLLLNASDRDNVELRAESLGSTMKFFTVGTQALLLDASQNATFAGTISSGQMSATNYKVGSTQIVTSGRSIQNIVNYAGTGEIQINGNLQATHVYNSGSYYVLNQAGNGWNTVVDRGNGNNFTVNALGGYKINGTTVIDANKNLTNIGTATLSSTTNLLLTLNPTAGNYGGILYQYGGVTKGTSIYNSGMMVYGGEASTSTTLQAGGQYGLFIHHSTRAVGIGTGTVAPAAKLEIKGSGGGNEYALKTTDASGNETFFVQDGGRVGVRYWPFSVGIPSTTAVATNAAFQVEESGLLTVLTTGKVGIGITNPTQKLTLQETHANGAVKDTLRITTTGSYSSSNSEEAGAAISFGQFHNSYPTWQTGLITGIRDGNNWNGSLAFYTNTGSSETSITEKMRITGAGNVGIGTISPPTKLSVNGDLTVLGTGRLYFDTTGADRTNFIQTINNYETIIQNTRGNAGYAVLGNSDIRFGFGTTNSVTETDVIIKSDGKVGIGTLSPSEKLHVEGSLVLNVASSSGLGEEGIFFRNGYSNANKYNISIMAFAHDGSGNFSDGLSINGYDGVSFCTGSNTRQERMRIVGGTGTSSGHVGIGTTDPGASKLKVYNSTVTGNTQLHIHNDKTGDAAVLKLEGKRTSLSDTGQLIFANNGNNVAKIDARSAADDGELRFFTSASGTGTNMTQRMVIDKSGAVLVQYTAPSGNEKFGSKGDRAQIAANNGGHGKYETVLTASFTGGQAKYIRIQMNGGNIQAGMRVHACGNYSNIDANGSFEKAYTIAANSSNTALFGGGTASSTITDLGSTSDHLSMGSLSKPNATTVYIPVANLHASYTILFSFAITIMGEIDGIGTIDIINQ